jgi:hypothetical protein
MPTIVSKKAWSHYVKLFESSFNSHSGNTISNLLWQIMHHDECAKDLVVFHPIFNGSQDNDHLTLGRVFAGRYGYQNLNVEFNEDIEYEQAIDICNDLSNRLFGINEQTANALITLSMTKPRILIEIDEQNATGATITSNMDIFDLLIVDRDDENYDENPGIKYWNGPDLHYVEKLAKHVDARDDNEEYNRALILTLLQYDM